MGEQDGRKIRVAGPPVRSFGAWRGKLSAKRLFTRVPLNLGISPRQATLHAHPARLPTMSIFGIEKLIAAGVAVASGPRP